MATYATHLCYSSIQQLGSPPYHLERVSSPGPQLLECKRKELSERQRIQIIGEEKFHSLGVPDIVNWPKSCSGGGGLQTGLLVQVTVMKKMDE